MADPRPASAVAKECGLYLGQIYAYYNKGLIKNYLEGGYPTGKGMKVDIDEVREAMSMTKKKGPRKPKGMGAGTRTKAKGPDGESVAATPKARKLKAGTIVSYENGRPLNGTSGKKPSYTVAQVMAATGKLTYLDDGNHHRHYSGVELNSIVFGTERLSQMLAKGVAHIERPASLLGMVMFQFIVEGNMKLAGSLEKWVEANGLEVSIPEPMDVDEDDEEPLVHGIPTLIANEGDSGEALAGEE